ncbi:hypothetical protein D3C87_65050 [compost metagenome]
MNRFYRNLIIVIGIIGLAVFLFFRFIENYTSTMDKMYPPFGNTEEDESESDEVSDTSTYTPENQK